MATQPLWFQLSPLSNLFYLFFFRLTFITSFCPYPSTSPPPLASFLLPTFHTVSQLVDCSYSTYWDGRLGSASPNPTNPTALVGFREPFVVGARSPRRTTEIDEAETVDAVSASLLLSIQLTDSMNSYTAEASLPL